MTMEEKQAIIEKNLKNDPALKAEYQALAADLASPEEAAKKLESDPELSARYAAIMAKITSGVEFEDEELGCVNGGMAFVPGIFQSLFKWMFGGTQLLTSEPASAGKSSPQTDTLVYDPAKRAGITNAVYDPSNPVSPSPLGMGGGADGKMKLL